MVLGLVVAEVVDMRVVATERVECYIVEIVTSRISCRGLEVLLDITSTAQYVGSKH